LKPHSCCRKCRPNTIIPARRGRAVKQKHHPYFVVAPAKFRVAGFAKPACCRNEIPGFSLSLDSEWILMFRSCHFNSRAVILW
jgi:hypothetical protein